MTGTGAGKVVAILVVCLCVDAMVVMTVGLVGIYHTRWNTEDQARVTCIEARGNAAAHAFCVQKGLDRP